MHSNSKSESYAAAGVDITAGYKAVELMKAHIKRTRNEGCLDDVGGFGGCFGLNLLGMEEPVLVSGTDGCGTKVKMAILMDKHDTIGIDAVAMCVNDTNGKAREVVILERHQTGMLSGLASDERRAGLNAALCNAANDGSDLFGVVLAASDVVKEEERLCAAANDVVYAHCNRVDTDGVMLVHEDSELYFRTAAVRTGNEYGLFHACGKTKATAKAAYIIEATCVLCTCDMGLHKLYCFVTGGNINACCCVTFRSRIFHFYVSLSDNLISYLFLFVVLRFLFVSYLTLVLFHQY